MPLLGEVRHWEYGSSSQKYSGSSQKHVAHHKETALRRKNTAVRHKSMWVITRKLHLVTKIRRFVTKILSPVLYDTSGIDPHLNEKKRSGIIAKHINNTYGKSFNPKTVAKELARMYEEELIDREDKTGKGSVFYYGLKSPIIDDN